MTDVMISYSRRDGDFVRRLYSALREQGREVWVDWQDIPLSADWWQEIATAIESADTFVFIVSPDSMGSPICNLEIAHARENNKRLVPILYRATDLEDAIDRLQERELSDNTEKVLGGKSIENVARENWNAVSRHNWLYFEDTDFEGSIKRLIDVIELDLEHAKEHTRLLVRATEWEKRNKSASFLLTGEAVSEAEQWLMQGVSKNPAPTALHADYINASSTAQAIRQRRTLVAVSVGLVISLVLAVVAGFLAVYANGQRAIAVENAATATVAQGEAIIQADIAATSAAEANSLLWASYAGQVLENGDSPLALSLALAAADLDAPPALAQRTLSDVAYAPGPKARFGEPDPEANAKVNAISVSANGELAALGLFDQRVLVINLETGETVNEFTGHTLSVQDVAFLPNSEQVVSVAFNQIILFDINTLEPILEMEQPNRAIVNAVAVTYNGRQAVTGSLDGNVVLWDLQTGEPLQTFSGHRGSVNDVVFSPDGNQILSGGEDDRMLLWDIETGDILQTFTTSSDVTTVAFHRSGDSVMSGNQLGEVIEWDVESGDSIQTLGENATIRHQGQQIQSVAFSPDGFMAASAGADQVVIVWDLRTGAALDVFDAHDATVNSVTFSPDRRTLLSGSDDNTVYVWSIGEDAVIQSLVVGGHNAIVRAMSYSSDGEKIATGDEDGVLIVWNTDSGRAANRYSNTPGAHLDGITAMTFLPDSLLFLTGSEDATMVLWDAEDNTQTLQRFEGHTGSVNAIATNPSGTLALSGSSEGELILWDIESGEQIRAFSAGDDAPAHRRDVTAIAMIDDTRALSAAEDRTAILWNVEDGTPIHTFDHRSRVIGVGISPDGTQAYTADNDDVIIIWDIASGDELTQLPIGIEGQERSVTSVTFNRNTNTAIVGYVDGNVTLWSMDLLRPLAIYDNNRLADSSRQQVTAITMKDDGMSAMVAARNLAVFEVRTLPLASLVEWTRDNRFIRDLTCVERQTYNLPPYCEEAVEVLETTE